MPEQTRVEAAIERAEIIYEGLKDMPIDDKLNGKLFDVSVGVVTVLAEKGDLPTDGHIVGAECGFLYGYLCAKFQPRRAVVPANEHPNQG